MKNNFKSYTLISIAIALWYIFISHFKVFSITSQSSILKLAILGIIPTIFILVNINKITIRLLDMMWMNLIIIFLMSTLVARDKGFAIFSTVKIVVFFILFYQLSRSSNWYEKAIRMLLSISGFHVMVTILHLLVPNLINLLNKILMDYGLYNVSMELYNYGFYSGLAGQTSFNALYIMVFIVIMYCKVLNEDKNMLRNSIFLLIGYYSLFLTNKRGPLIGIIIAQIIGYILFYMKLNRRNIKILIGSTLIILIMAITISQVEELQNIIERFEITENFSSNRDVLYTNIIVRAKESLIYGHGAGSLGLDLGISGHNLYLQLIYENGLIGLFVLLYILHYNLNLSYKLTKSAIINNSSDRIVLLCSYIFQISFLVYGLTESVFVNPTMFVSYVIFSAIPVSIHYNRYNKNMERTT